ncbi:MAG TPA: Rdx family protein [Fimbriimonadaceae bacterium]|nr:Rdx family protein [Fimbriimonadaceae bacterium]HRJ96997.1 Rdx family protein [Fimbriimonadaceae bacterium]
MAAAIVERFGTQVREIVLIPSGGGRFEITVDGTLVYSKLATGKHIDNDKAIELVKKGL